MSITMGDMKTFIRNRSALDGSSVLNEVMENLINQADRALHKSGRFSFDNRISTLVFAAEYDTGTISINSGATTVTGSGTTFTSAMVGRYIRFNGEDIQYRVTAYTSSTSLEVETYNGTANLSGESYVMTEPRMAMPANLRDLAEPNNGDTFQPRLGPIEIQRMLIYARVEKEVGTPRNYAYESALVSGVPTYYLWVYPQPSEQYIIQIPHTVWPVKKTSDSDIFEIPEPAEDLLELYIEAFLAKQMGNPNWVMMFNLAADSAQRDLGFFRIKNEAGRLGEWDPSVDPIKGEGFGYDGKFASGEPFYT